ncbi:MAG: glycosyltransferase [Ginsengibacter sp.]
MDKHLHIVCLDVPFPPDYGGVFDLYYKIVALHQQGVKIHLHCFEYGRGKQYDLNYYCTEVNYYKRRKNIMAFFSGIPHIAASRANNELLHNLLKDDHPVLLEGIHCTWFLYQNKLKEKKVLIRLHNVEYDYYFNLAKVETSLMRKLYFFTEGWLLKRYEKKVAEKALCVAVSKNDISVYNSEFGITSIEYLPVFLPYIKLNCVTGNGDFYLYHGNLSVIENEIAVEWLLENVHDPAIPFIIAGKNPSKKLVDLGKTYTGVSIIENPTTETLNELIRSAQVHLLPSFNSSGIKIKLINALFNGRHCLVNQEAGIETELELLCHVSKKKDYKKKAAELFTRPFTEQDIELRSNVLLDKFNNQKNALQLMQWIY